MAVQLKTLRAEIVPDLSKIAPGLAQADGLFDAFAKRTRAAPAVPIAPPDPRVASALETIARSAQQATGASERVGQAFAATGIQANKSERELLQYAQAVARLQQTSGDAAGAQQTLATALDAVEKQSVQAVRATQQLERMQGQSEKLTGSFDKLTGALGTLGVAFGAQQILQFGSDALGAANSLEKTEATVRALSGSQERYNEVLAVAEAGQQLYGGSLESNLQSLGSFVNLSNRAGVELGQLDNLSRRLAAVDPTAGLEGAGVALKELFSGSGAESTLSLRKRFELDRSVLEKLERQGISATEKARLLDQALNDLGITNDLLNERADTTAAKYDRLASAFDNAKVALGGFLAQAGERAVVGTTRILEGDLRTAFAGLAQQMGLSAGQAALLFGIFTAAEGEAQGYAAGIGNIAQASNEVAQSTSLAADELTKIQAKLETTSERGSEATERLREAQARFADDTADRREQLARRLADAEQEGAARLADLTQQSAEQRAQLEQDFGERRADAARDIATEIARIDENLAETQSAIVEQRTQRLADIQARLVDAQEGLNQELARQQQSYEDRLADLQTRSADSRIDRQADAAQKLADLQAQLGQATDAEDQARIQRQIDRANQDAAEKEARATRDEARALEKLERDRARDEERARQKAAQQEAELQAQIAKEEAASAAKLAKAEQDAAADRQRAQAAAQARLAELDTQQAEELAKLDAKTAAERQKIAAAQAEQLEDLRTGFAQDEQERAKAFARQETQLKEKLGRELSLYLDYQEQLGLIDAKTVATKRAAIAERFGGSQDTSAREFAALAAGLGNEGTAALAQRSLGLLGGLGNLPGLGALTSTVNAITVPQIIIQGVSDPETTARMVRDEINRINRQNGSSGLS